MKTVKGMLKEIMNDKGYDCQRLAKELRVDKAQVSRWLIGAKPKPCNMTKIEKLYKETKNPG